MTVDDVVHLNDMVRRRYPDDTTGGRADRQGVDCIVEGAFGSMYGQPLHPTVHGQAAALMEGLIRLHPFRDGNKRTALLAACSFLLANGHAVVLPPDADAFVVGVAKNTDRETRALLDGITAWLEGLEPGLRAGGMRS